VWVGVGEGKGCEEGIQMGLIRCNDGHLRERASKLTCHPRLADTCTLDAFPGQRAVKLRGAATCSRHRRCTINLNSVASAHQQRYSHQKQCG